MTINKERQIGLKKIKYFINKNSSQRIISTILIIAIIITSYILLFDKNNTQTEEKDNAKLIKKVSIQVVDKDKNYSSSIESVASVVANTKIDVVALTNGTLKNIYFKNGDLVELNQVLAQMYNDTSLTTLNNAQTNLNNSRNSLLSIERIGNETISQTEFGIKQAELGLENAEKSIVVAELGLKIAEDNLNNANDLREKGNLDTKNNAITNFNGFLNSIFNANDQVENLINADNPNLTNPLLGAKDIDILRQTQTNYKLSTKYYDSLLVLEPKINSINTDMQKLLIGLSLAEKMLNNTVDLLDNTVSGSNYPESYINSQKNIFINLRASMIAAENSAEAISQGLNTIPLSNEFELDNLENAVSAAKNQLAIANNAKSSAKISLENAELGLTSAKTAKDQQLIGAQSQVDNAGGQVNLSLTQTNNLTIKTPISGTITRKYVEMGTEISPGQKIAEISQINNLKIIVNLSPVDVYRVKIGQEVLIQGMHKAFVSNISPAADPISKKVKIEILFDNSEGLLIPGTFVDVSIKLEKTKKSNSDSIFIPLRSVSITQNEKFIFIVENGLAKKKTITIGKTDGAFVEILDGLNDKDELIVNGAKNLEDGDEIEISNI